MVLSSLGLIKLKPFDEWTSTSNKILTDLNTYNAKVKDFIKVEDADKDIKNANSFGDENKTQENPDDGFGNGFGDGGENSEVAESSDNGFGDGFGDGSKTPSETTAESTNDGFGDGFGDGGESSDDGFGDGFSEGEESSNTSGTTQSDDGFGNGFSDESSVNTEVIESQSTPKTTINSNNAYHLIAGSFKDETSANKFARKITKQGYTPEIVEKSSEKYFVTYFSFNSKKEALKKLKQLTSNNVQTWLYKK